MTKKELVKAIINLEYTKEDQANVKGLVKGRSADLMRNRKAYLEDYLDYLNNR